MKVKSFQYKPEEFFLLRMLKNVIPSNIKLNIIIDELTTCVICKKLIYSKRKYFEYDNEDFSIVSFSKFVGNFRNALRDIVVFYYPDEDKYKTMHVKCIKNKSILEKSIMYLTRVPSGKNVRLSKFDINACKSDNMVKFIFETNHFKLENFLYRNKKTNEEIKFEKYYKIIKVDDEHSDYAISYYYEKPLPIDINEYDSFPESNSDSDSDSDLESELELENEIRNSPE